MLFNSIEFLFIFLPIVFCIYYLLIKFNLAKWTNLWLLIASVFFYAYYKIEYLPIIISSIIFNYVMGWLIQNQQRKGIKIALVVTAILGNLFLLCYYKYFNFLIETINSFHFTHFDTMKLFLPLGISFFTFQQIGYITDSYKGEAKHTNIIDYSLFVSFFPQLIAGPICTHKELIPQFQDMTKKIFNKDSINLGTFMITAGLFKKVILADGFTDFIQTVIAQNAMREFFTSWAFAFSIAMQGYFDFSGYCDMALGIAALFNIAIPINFDSPYKSLDISDYWRRWHITMGRFLKYHVYIPMGGSRRGNLRTYWNLFFVFLITGIWHGANWPCVFYGTINGILVCINKLWKKTEIQMNAKLAVFITFITMVSIAPLVMVKHIYQYFITISSMLGIHTFFVPVVFDKFNMVFFDPDLQLNALLFFASFIIIFCFKNSNELAPKYVATEKSIYTYLLAAVFIFSALSITKHSEFIYFNF
ncbi:MAG: hypothetical protein K6C94_05100 [Candidatus Gastranaerophilales bacterium]|nr:hypothetical protein [Candidatus Gastranaerophilales bacterium]